MDVDEYKDVTGENVDKNLLFANRYISVKSDFVCKRTGVLDLFITKGST